MILVRHGQSHFNVVYGAIGLDPLIADPGLTDHGRGQAETTARALAGNGFRRVLSSPYRRALQTAHIIAAHLDLPHGVDPLIGERAAFVCDIGTPTSNLSGEWPHLALDHLPEQWWPHREETESALHERCQQFQAGMAQAPDWEHVIVVSHWGFIRALTGTPLKNCETIRFQPHRATGQ